MKFIACAEKNVEFNKTVAIDREKATSTNSNKKVQVLQVQVLKVLN